MDTDRTLCKLEDLLRVITGSDYNVIVYNKLDKIGYAERRHTRTKAIAKLNN